MELSSNALIAKTREKWHTVDAEAPTRAIHFSLSKSDEGYEKPIRGLRRVAHMIIIIVGGCFRGQHKTAELSLSSPVLFLSLSINFVHYNTFIPSSSSTTPNSYSVP